MEKLKKVLLVDDDYISNRITEEEIKSSKLVDHIEIAYHGEEGLNKLKASGKDNYDLIILDFNMPVMNGIEFLKKLNELDLQPKPKVVVLSSSHDPKEIEQANEYNIIGFINKPFYVSKLRPLLHNRF